MTANVPIEHVFPTTTYEARRETIAPAAGGTSTARRSRSAWRGLVRWPRARRLRLDITYKAGAEDWYLVQCRDRAGIFPGSMALEDVMARVYGER